MRFKRFKPMRMDNVSISTKLWVLVGVLALPIVVLMGTQFVSLQDSVDRTDKARAGVAFAVDIAAREFPVGGVDCSYQPGLAGQVDRGIVVGGVEG